MSYQFYTSLVLFIFLTVSLFSQSALYSDKNANTVFISNAPKERIESGNADTRAVLDINSGEIAVLVPITGFQFKKKLMRKHFNEQYLESDIFKDASFSGKIENLDYSLLTSNEKEYRVIGKLNIHGIEKDFDGIAKLSREEEIIVGITEFQINLDHYDIHIPKLFSKQISRIIQINCKVRLGPSDEK